MRRDVRRSVADFRTGAGHPRHLQRVRGLGPSPP